jgi:hypothetical protein
VILPVPLSEQLHPEWCALIHDNNHENNYDANYDDDVFHEHLRLCRPLWISKVS